MANGCPGSGVADHVIANGCPGGGVTDHVTANGCPGVGVTDQVMATVCDCNRAPVHALRHGCARSIPICEYWVTVWCEQPVTAHVVPAALYRNFSALNGRTSVARTLLYLAAYALAETPGAIANQSEC